MKYILMLYNNYLFKYYLLLKEINHILLILFIQIINYYYV